MMCIKDLKEQRKCGLMKIKIINISILCNTNARSTINLSVENQIKYKTNLKST